MGILKSVTGDRIKKILQIAKLPIIFVTDYIIDIVDVMEGKVILIFIEFTFLILKLIK